MHDEIIGKQVVRSIQPCGYWKYQQYVKGIENAN
jgi:hypothetical protein